MDIRILFVVLLVFFGVDIVYAQDSVDQNGMPPQGGQGMGGQRNGQPSAPPQFAIDACKEKSEGSTCQIGEAGAGTCGYTPDKKYFVCKPDPMPSGGQRGPHGPGGPGSSEVRDNPDGTISSTF